MSATEVFDDAYWQRVDARGESCEHCGCLIVECESSPTGYTHGSREPDMAWTGIRCPGMLHSATPAGGVSDNRR